MFFATETQRVGLFGIIILLVKAVTFFIIYTQIPMDPTTQENMIIKSNYMLIPLQQEKFLAITDFTKRWNSLFG